MRRRDSDYPKGTEWSLEARRIAFRALITGLAAALLQLAILREGIWFTPDSWAYWQGSVSLMHGEGYSYFYGTGIRDWPPLFSVYLMCWQWVFGVSGATLLAATIALTGVCAAAWVVLLSTTLRSKPSPASGWCCLFVGVLLAQATRHLMSESLTNALLPILLGVGVHASRTTSIRRFVVSGLVVGVVGALMVLTRNAAASFVCGAAALLLLNSARHWLVRLGTGVLAAGMVAITAVVTDSVLGLSEAFPVGFGIGKYDPAQYLLQMLRGIGDVLAPSPVGVCVWAIIVSLGLSRMVPEGDRTRVRLYVVFSLTSAAALFVMFNLTFVVAELKGRFLLFVPLATVAAVLMVAPTMASRRMRIVLLVVSLALPVGKTVKHVVMGRGFAASEAVDARALEAHFVRPHFTIHPDHHAQPPVRRGDHLLVPTPRFTGLGELVLPR